MTSLASDVVRELGARSLIDQSRSAQIENQLDVNGYAVLNRVGHGSLIVGVPGTPLITQQETIGIRCAAWPDDVLNTSRTAILSSRLGRNLHSQSEWFTALRHVLQRTRDHAVLAAGGTTADRFLQRAPDLYGVRIINIEIVPWAGVSPAPSGNAIRIGPSLTDPSPRAPSADECLAALSTHVLVLRARTNGNVHRVIQNTLSQKETPQCVHVLKTGARNSLVKELIDRGAVAWEVPADPQPAPGSTSTPSKADRSRTRHHPPFDDYLLHWTRAHPGPWPDETEADFLDGLITGSDLVERSPLVTLRRILESGRVLATHRLIRGGTPTVCFSGCPLNELPPRQYRRHLGRWDYERYGVAIRRSWLVERGMRPVTYGSTSEYSDLRPESRPFYQVISTQDHAIRWTIEREWRSLQDIDLTKLPDTAAFAFVPTRAEAETLSRWSRFPVVIAE